MKHMKYLTTLAMGILIFICGIVAFNLIIDPLGSGGFIPPKYKPIFSEQKQKYRKIFFG